MQPDITDGLCHFRANGSFLPEFRSVGALALSGLGVGSLAGLFGVGGGFLIVPLLHSLMGLSMQRAIASSLLIIALVASSGFLAHTLITPIADWHLLTLLGAGAIAGMLAGSHCAARMHTKTAAKGLRYYPALPGDRYACQHLAISAFNRRFAGRIGQATVPVGYTGERRPMNVRKTVV